MSHLAAKGRVIPLLLDMSEGELVEACPPFMNLTPVSMGDPRRMAKLREDLRSLFDEGDGVSELRKAHDDEATTKFTGTIETIIAEGALLPDRAFGQVYYNRNIKGSRNFNMPNLFDHFAEEIYLVGINHNFLLNIPQRPELMTSLLKSLAASKRRKIRILVADLWGPPEILYTYNEIIFGNAKFEMPGLTRVFQNEKDIFYIDNFIKEFCNTNDVDYGRIRSQLAIKSIPILMDTFWFVDVDLASGRGDMMLLPMTAGDGNDRYAIYAKVPDQRLLVEYYYLLCERGWEHPKKETLWPPMETIPRQPN